MLDRLALVRFARLVGFTGLVGLVGLVGICGAGFEVGRGVCRYHRRGVVRVEGVPGLRPVNVANCLSAEIVNWTLNLCLRDRRHYRHSFLISDILDIFSIFCVIVSSEKS